MKRGRCILNRRPGPNDRSRSRGLAVLLCALLLALAPAINLSAPVGMRAEPDVRTAPASDANLAGAAPVAIAHADMHGVDATSVNAHDVHRDDARHDSAHHDGAPSHHADPLCLQCIAFGTPGLPGVPDLPSVAVFLQPVSAGYGFASDPSYPSRHPAAQGCRDPPALG